LTLKSPSLVRPTRPCPVPPMLTFFSLPSLSLSLSPLPNLVLFSQVIAFDKLDYCASLHNLDEIKDKPNFKVSLRGDGKKKRKKKNRRVFRLRRWSKRRERERNCFFSVRSDRRRGRRPPEAPALAPCLGLSRPQNRVSLTFVRRERTFEFQKGGKEPAIFPVLFLFSFFFSSKEARRFPQNGDDSSLL